MAAASLARQQTEEAFLDAAERLLVERRPRRRSRPAVAAGGRRQPRPRALLLRLDGGPARARARAVHRPADRAPAGDVRGARTSRSSRSGGRRCATWTPTATYQKVWFELQALAWNRPELRERVAARQRRVARGAHRGVRRAARALRDRHAARRAGLARDHVQPGVILERLSGIETGQAELLEWIDGWLEQERAMTTTEAPAPRASRPAPAIPTRRATSSATASASSRRSTATGEPTVLLLPTWSIIHSRHWKAQIPYLARHARVVTFDGRGNGSSDRPDTAEAYAEREFAADALAVMDATGTERAVLVGLSAGARWGIAARRRAPGAGRRRGRSSRPPSPFAQHPARVDARRSTSRSTRYEGWAQVQPPLLARATTRDFLEFFFGQVFTEPHSTKQIEDCVGWGLETDAGDARAHATSGRAAARPRRVARALPPDRSARCSSSTATEDAIRPHAVGEAARRGRPAARSSRSRAPGTARTRATRCASTCCCASSSRPRPAPRALDRAAAARPQARALHLLADRARPRPARRRDRARAARAPSRPRDRLARAAPGDRRARGRGRARAPGEPRCSPTSRATSSPSPPSTTCTASRRGGGWTRSWSPTSWSSTTSCARSTTTCGSATRRWEIDYYLHENPEREARRLRVAHRLRRLAADARRRRARGRSSPPTTTPR